MTNVLVLSEWNLVNNWIGTVFKGFQKGKAIFNPLHRSLKWLQEVTWRQGKSFPGSPMQPNASASLLPTSQALSSLRGLFAIPGRAPHGAEEEYYLVPNFPHSEQWPGAQDRQRGAVLKDWELSLIHI